MKHLFTAFVLLLAANASAQIIFDLSDSKTKVEYIDIDKDPVLVIKNMIPNPAYQYTHEVEFREVDVPPISIAGDSSMLTDSLSDFDKAYDALKNATDEGEVPDLIKKLEKEIGKLNAQEFPAQIQKGRQLLEATTSSKSLQFGLRNNQEITVTVTRTSKTDKGKDTTIQWMRTFKTPEKSPWSIMYGFTFTPNLMNPVMQYFSEGDTATNTYTITPLHNRNNYFFKNLSPTLMITWTPMSRYRFNSGFWRALVSNHFSQLGFTAGLTMNFATETANVSVLAAPSLVIAKNVSLSFGACLTQKSVLKGKYTEGQRIQENLDFDQLHEKQFMGEWFISLAIRFEKSPFEKKETDSKD
jgi:hypothetical protein